MCINIHCRCENIYFKVTLKDLFHFSELGIVGDRYKIVANALFFFFVEICSLASSLVIRFPFKPQSHVARIQCGNVEKSWSELELERSGRKSTQHWGKRAL